MAIKNMELAMGMARKRVTKVGEASIWFNKRDKAYHITSKECGDAPPKNSELIRVLP